MCSVDVDGYSSVWREAVHTSRKERTCDCCWTPIHPGQTYLSHFSVHEGEPTAGEACLACHVIAKAFGEAHGVTLSASGLWEELSECVKWGGGRLPAADRGGPTPWASELAAIERRRRVSPTGRKNLSTRWAYLARVRAERAARMERVAT